MKKLLPFLLCLCLAFSLCSFSVLADEPEEVVGYSSARVETVDLSEIPNILKYADFMENPPAFKITNAAGLCEFSEIVNMGDPFDGVTVYLANDIDMTDVTDFKPIAKTITFQFKGTFDGQGHVIDNLKLDNSAAENVSNVTLTGLFGNAMSATIKNLVLGSNCEIKYAETSGDARTAAVVANINQDVTVDNVYSMATVIGVRYTGAIVGFVNQAAGSKTVVNCTNTGTVTGNAGVGGIIGMVAQANTSVRNCRNTGAVICRAVKADGFNVVAGGIVGRCWADQLVIDGCINNGAISCVGVTGGLLGALQLKNATVTNSINYGALNGAEQGLCGKIADEIAVTDTGSQNLAGEEDSTLSTVETITPNFPTEEDPGDDQPNPPDNPNPPDDPNKPEDTNAPDDPNLPENPNAGNNQKPDNNGGDTKETGTDAPATSAAPSGKNKGGCQSFVGGCGLILAVCVAGLVAVKKKSDE